MFIPENSIQLLYKQIPFNLNRMSFMYRKSKMRNYENSPENSFSNHRSTQNGHASLAQLPASKSIGVNSRSDSGYWQKWIDVHLKMKRMIIVLLIPCRPAELSTSPPPDMIQTNSRNHCMVVIVHLHTRMRLEMEEYKWET